MLTLQTRPHDRVELSASEFGWSLEDAAQLPWVVERIARVRRTRLGIEVIVGPFVGQLVIPDHLILNVEEIFPGTLRACLNLSTGGRRGGPQETERGALAVRPWEPVLTRFADGLMTYIQQGAEKRYLNHRVTTGRPRGRIDIPRTATRVWARGRTDLLACEVRLLTEDTALNRLLASATVRAEAIAIQTQVRSPLRDLRRASIALSGAKLVSMPNVRAARSEINPQIPGLVPLVALAEVILSGVPALPPPRLEDETVPISAWLNVEKIFEEAVRAVVSDNSPAGSVRAGQGDGVRLLANIPDHPDGSLAEADPDVIIDTPGRVLLLDAKYRRHGDAYSEDELYQLIAHARAYRAHAGALVAPAVERPPGIYPIGMDTAQTRYYLIAVDPTSEADIQHRIGSWINAQLEPISDSF